MTTSKISQLGLLASFLISMTRTVSYSEPKSERLELGEPILLKSGVQVLLESELEVGPVAWRHAQNHEEVKSWFGENDPNILEGFDQALYIVANPGNSVSYFIPKLYPDGKLSLYCKLNHFQFGSKGMSLDNITDEYFGKVIEPLYIFEGESKETLEEAYKSNSDTIKFYIIEFPNIANERELAIQVEVKFTKKDNSFIINKVALTNLKRYYECDAFIEPLDDHKTANLLDFCESQMALKSNKPSELSSESKGSAPGPGP